MLRTKTAEVRPSKKATRKSMLSVWAYQAFETALSRLPQPFAGARNCECGEGAAGMLIAPLPPA